MTPTESNSQQPMQGVVAPLLLAMQAAFCVDDVQANYLDVVADVVRASAYGFTHFDPDRERLTPRSVLARGAPAGLVPAYNALGANNDPLLVAALSARKPVDNSRLMSDAVWQQQSVHGVLSGQGLYHSMAVPLIVNSQVLGALYLARSPDEGPFAGRDIEVMSAAKKHVEIALHRSLRVEALDRRASLFAWVLDELDLAVIVGSPDGQTFYENRALRRLARTYPSAAAQLPETLAANARELRSGSRRVVASSEQLPLCPPAPSQSPVRAHHHLVVRSTMPRRATDTMISFVFVNRGDVPTPVELMPLSAREREVVAWVAEGLTNRQIAERAFVSENTVRQHLKRIFSKLGVHNRAQLVQAVWRDSVERS